MTGPGVLRARRKGGPRKKGWGKRAKHLLAYVALRVTWGTLALLPAPVLFAVGRALGRLLALTPLRSAAVRNIRKAYGDASPHPRFPTADALARACLEHYGLLLVECVLLDRWQPTLLTRCTLPPYMEPMKAELLGRGRGIVVATGHISNWELMARAFHLMGFNAWTLARAPFDGRVADWLSAWRERGGVRGINRGDQAGMRAVRDHVASGGGLGVLVDVDTPVKSAFVPFFGHIARTPTAAADLAIKFNAPLVVAWSWREEPGRYAGEAVEVPLDLTGDHDADVIRITAQVTAHLERAIRAHPEQWIWTHRRWKTPPPAELNPSPPTSGSNSVHPVPA